MIIFRCQFGSMREVANFFQTFLEMRNEQSPGVAVIVHVLWAEPRLVSIPHAKCWTTVVGEGFTSFPHPCAPRPYGKDVPRLDYWLAYETIMKKVGGRPHWAKVGFTVGATPPRPSFPLH